ncbi:MAG TPA: FAD-dependent tricarballylate dehydrogenase TcuA [Chloroflexota bacterium]|nr:FAD-dependent tricarballylate dehydrogenase TcuA [Chloroflexota bacterium]
MESYDVVVVGAGNAGLCAALSAREAGARVAVLEKAPRAERGGNTAFTGGLLRFPFQGIEEIKPLIPDYTADELSNVDVGRYTQHDYASDLERVTEGLSDPALVETLVGNAYPTMRWMRDRGVRWLLALGRQSYKVGETYRFFGNLILEAHGGGQGLSDRLFEIAEGSGIEIRYDTKATGLDTNANGAVTGVRIRDQDGVHNLSARSVVLASGGFEANREMRTRYLGPDWELAKVRGTRFNTGDSIQMALAIGAQSYGHWSCCHAVAWDLLANEVGDLRIGDLHQKHSYPLGIVVNRLGQRFVDEGADFRNYTYAKYGREILKQPGRQAFQIFDSKTVPMLRDEYRIKEATRGRANTIAELADQLTIDQDGLSRTVAEFNAAIRPGEFNPSILDGKHTEGITPPKSNWAIPIDEPPFEGYAVTCGITFTFGGLRINPRCQVLDTENRPIPGLFAAGELVGGLFYYNYPGGSGLMAGAVFGRIAGMSAGEHSA